jgi:hypothetical protein
MKKIVRITESEINNIVKKVLKEDTQYKPTHNEGDKLKAALESELEKYQKLLQKALRYKHLPKYQEDIEVLRDKIKDTKDAINTGNFT